MLAMVSGQRQVGEGLRSLFSGTTPYSAVGVVFAAIGLAFVASILLSPGGWQWWLDARSVHGTERDGIVYYSYGGTNYTVDDAGSNRTGPRTVYVIPSEPSNASLYETPTQVLDWGMTAGPLVLAGLFIGAGFAEKRRAEREQRAYGRGAFGRGLDRETMERLLDEQRRGIRSRPRPPNGSGPR